MELQDRIAVVTGGASGIGRATAVAMARHGADIVLADLHESRLDAARREIEALGRRVLAVRCNVAEGADVQRLAREAIATMGRVDLLMNNAGVIVRGALEQIPMADWAWIFDVNVLGVVRGVRAFLPHMIERRSGYIINTASIAGLFALTGEGAPYVASKFAVVGLTEALALYARPYGIAVSLLCPASVDTNLAETERSVGFASPERAAAEHAAARSVMAARLMTPEEVAAGVIDAVREERFFILPDPSPQPLVARRAADMNAYMAARLEGRTP